MHGLQYAPDYFLGPDIGSVTFTNSRTTCPVCGQLSFIVDGTYDVVGGAVQAFTSSSTEAVAKFRSILEAVQKGSLSRARADHEIEQIGGPLASFWKSFNAYSGTISLLLTLIAIYVSVLSYIGSADSSEKLQVSIDKQMEIQQQMLVELQKQNQASNPKAGAQSAQQHPNRHERRKAKKLGKRKQ